MIKCGCSRQCECCLIFGPPRDGEVRVHMKNNRDGTMYLDANGIVKLIAELKEVLKVMTDG